MKKSRKAWFFNGLYIVTFVQNVDGTLPKIDDKYAVEGTKIYVTIGNEFADNNFSYELKKINYPTSINCYYNNSLPLYDEQTGWVQHGSLITLIDLVISKKEEAIKEHYFYDCLIGYYDYEFMSKRYDEKGIKGYSNFQVELGELLYIMDKKEKPFLFINEVSIMEYTRRSCEVNYYIKSKTLIEKRIRDKNYFLSKFSKEVIEKIVEAIFLETIAGEKKNECIIQDTLIHVSDSDYDEFEQEINNELFDSIKDFLARNKDGFVADFIFDNKTDAILKNVIRRIDFDDIRFLNLAQITDILLDYRKLNFNLSKTLYKNTGKRYGFKIMPADDDFIKKNAYLKNNEKTDYRNRLKRVIEKLKTTELFIGKDKYL